MGVEGGGGVNLSFAAMVLESLEEPKERVDWEPLAAGPPEVRERRVAGIFVMFLVMWELVCIW